MYNSFGSTLQPNCDVNSAQSSADRLFQQIYEDMGIRSVNETQQQQQQQQWRDEDAVGNNENWRMSEYWSAKCIDNTSCDDTAISEMRKELHAITASKTYESSFKNAKRLLERELERLDNNMDPEWLEVDVPTPIKLVKKILIPIYRHPEFNFVGKIIGSRGEAMHALANRFKCHVRVLGKGSTRDFDQENKLLKSGDSQYLHFGDPLHVRVETVAPAVIAYARMAGLLEVLSHAMIPIRDDDWTNNRTVNMNGGTMMRYDKNAVETNDDYTRKMNGNNNYHNYSVSDGVRNKLFWSTVYLQLSTFEGTNIYGQDYCWRLDLNDLRVYRDYWLCDDDDVCRF